MWFCSYDEYISKLERRGFKYLASGSFGSVYHKPGAPYVLKLGCQHGDAWPAYAAYCMDNPGPFRPVVRSLKWHYDEVHCCQFYVAVVERLSATLLQARNDLERCHNKSFVRM
jgi:hypothetical protein